MVTLSSITVGETKPWFKKVRNGTAGRTGILCSVEKSILVV